MRAPVRARATLERWRRSCGEKLGTPAPVQARARAVRKRSAPKPPNTGRSGTRSSRGTSAETAANSCSGGDTHRAAPVLATAARTRQRPRVSSTSPRPEPRARRRASRSHPARAAGTCRHSAGVQRPREPCSALGGLTSRFSSRGSFTRGSRAGFGWIPWWSRIIASTLVVFRIVCLRKPASESPATRSAMSCGSSSAAG